MENSQSNKNSAVEGAKKKRTHFIASMAILSVALVLVVVIAVVTIIAGIGRASLSGDGLTLHGNSAGDLYSQLKTAAESTGNYSVTLTKQGGAQLKDSTLSVDIVTEIVSRIDGDDFYYKSVTKTTYIGPKGADKSVTEVVREICVVDGVAYIKSGDEKTKQTVTTDEYKESFDIFEVILWENDALFDGAQFESIFAGGYRVGADASNSKFKNTIYDDMRSFFSNQMSSWILTFAPVSSDAEYTVVYDNECKPTNIQYGYALKDAMDSFISGNIYMTADVSYGTAEIEIPADASEYTESEQ